MQQYSQISHFAAYKSVYPGASNASRNL